MCAAEFDEIFVISAPNSCGLGRARNRDYRVTMELDPEFGIKMQRITAPIHFKQWQGLVIEVLKGARAS